MDPPTGGVCRDAPDFHLVDAATAHASAEYRAFLDDLDEKDHRELYRLMVLARRLDAQAIALQRQGQLGVYTPLRGQEAAQIGAAYALGDRDWIMPAYRELGMALVRGLPANALLQLWRGTWYGNHDPHRYRFGLLSIPVATQALHGVGFAMAARLDGASLAVLTCLGDGATSAGDAHEAFNLAAVYDAPCVFFVQNNQYAISVPLCMQTRAPSIAHKAIGYGMPGYRCDGNDVLATYAVTRHAVERARRGEGPSLIEAVTYRMEAHTTADDPTRYRSREEVQAWGQRDPIRRFEAALDERGLLDEASREEVAEESEIAARELREQVTGVPAGDPLELFEHVYADPPATLLEQREVLRREQSTPSAT